MKTYYITETIKASPEQIWKILVDISDYPSWNQGVDKIEGHIAPGQKIKVFAKISPGRAFPAKVTTFIPHEKMVWTGGMPIKSLFKGERTFTLTPQDDGSTKFYMEEIFSGLMSPLIVPSIPDLNPSFRDFAQGLKAKAESTC